MNTNQITYTQVWQSGFDAGLYRQYIATKFGSLLLYGGSYDRWITAYRNIKHLARITGKTVDQIIKQAQKDYQRYQDQLQ